MPEPPVIQQSLTQGSQNSSIRAPSENQEEHQTIQSQTQALKSLNKNLESELQSLKEQLKNRSVVEPQLEKLQKLVNQVQVHNSQLRSENQKVIAALDAKEKLIAKLQEDVTETKVKEKGDILKLQAQIKKLKKDLEDGRIQFDKKVNEERIKINAELEEENRKVVGKKEEKIRLATQKNQELQTRIETVQQDYKSLEDDFREFKRAKNEQDIESRAQIDQLTELLDSNSRTSKLENLKLVTKLEKVENQNEVQVREISYLQENLNFLKQSTQSFLKQKEFLDQLLEKAQKEIVGKREEMQQQMLKENGGNMDYFVSVKKAQIQIDEVKDLALQFFNGIQKISSFMKLVKEEKQRKDSKISRPVIAEYKETEEEEEQKEINEEEVQEQQQDASKSVIEIENLEHQRQSPQQIMKSSTYYCRQCPNDIASAALKIIRELASSQEGRYDDLPFEFTELLKATESMSVQKDQEEVTQIFLQDIQVVINSKIQDLQEKIDQNELELIDLRQMIGADQEYEVKSKKENSTIQTQDLRSDIKLSPRKESENQPPILNQPSLAVSQLENHQNLTVVDKSQFLQTKAKTKTSILNQSTFVRKLSSAGMSQDEGGPNRSFTMAKTSGHPQQSQTSNQDKLELKKLQNELDQVKFQASEAQKQYGKYLVILQEKNDEEQEKHAEDIHKLEIQYETQISDLGEECRRRENQLVEQIKDLQEDLQIQKTSYQVLYQTKKEKVEENRKLEQLKDRLESELEKTKQALSTFETNYSQLDSYKNSQKGMFTLGFQLISENEKMLREQMLSSYLCRAMTIDRERLSLVSQYNIVQAEENRVAEFVFEIEDDLGRQTIQKAFTQLKGQIREGTCLLCDLDPIYLSIHLGLKGLRDSSTFSEYRLIHKTGLILPKLFQQELSNLHNVSIFRHKQSQTIKILAQDHKTGQEHLLTLDQEDLSSLIEGRSMLLEKPMEKDLVELILQQISLLQKDKEETLVCAQRIQFSKYVIGEYTWPPRVESKNLTYLYPQSFRGQRVENLQILEKQKEDQEIVTYLLNNGEKDSQIVQKVQKVKELASNVQTDTDDLLLSREFEQFKTVFQAKKNLGKLIHLGFELSQGLVSKQVNLNLRVLNSPISNQVYSFSFPQHNLNETQAFQHSIQVETLQVKLHSEETGQPYQDLLILHLEQLQQDGFLIRVHSLRKLITEELLILRSNSGEYSVVDREMDAFQQEPEIRQMLIELTLGQTEIWEFSKSPFILDLQKDLSVQIRQQDQQASILLPHCTAQKKEVKKLSLAQKELLKGLEDLKLGLVSEEMLNERGQMVFRDFFIVRCLEQSRKEVMQEAVITIREKMDIVTIEVFMHKLEEKIQISSRISETELYATNQALSLQEKIFILKNLLQKLFVINEGSNYHLKIESDQIGANELLQEKKAFLERSLTPEAEEILLKIQENPKYNLSNVMAEKLEEPEKIQEKYEIEIYYILKERKKQKRGTEEQMQSDEQEFQCNFKAIYIQLRYQEEIVNETVVTVEKILELSQYSPSQEAIKEDLQKPHWQRNQLISFIKNQMEIKENYLNLQKVEKQSDLQLQLSNKTQLSYQLLQRQKAIEQTKFDIEFQEETELIMNYELEMAENVVDFKMYENNNYLIFQLFLLSQPDSYFSIVYNKQSDQRVGNLNVLSIDLAEVLEEDIRETQRKYIDQNLLFTIKLNQFPATVEISLCEVSSLMQWIFKYPLKLEKEPQAVIIDEAILQAFNKISLSSLVLRKTEINGQENFTFESSDGVFNLQLTQKEGQAQFSVNRDEEQIYSQIFDTSKFQICQELIKIPLTEEDQEIQQIKLQSYFLILLRTFKSEEGSSLVLEIFLIKDLEEEFQHLKTFSLQIENEIPSQPDSQTLLDAFYSILSPEDKEFYLKQLMLEPLIEEQNEEEQDEEDNEEGKEIKKEKRQLEFSQEEIVQILEKYSHRNKSYDQLTVLTRKTCEEQGKLVLISVQANIPMFLKQLSDLQEVKDAERNSQEKNLDDISPLKPLPDQFSSLANLRLKHQGIKSFLVSIQEPENEIQQQFEARLDECFQQQELANLDLKSVRTLKRLARLFLEEKAVIKRVQTFDEETQEEVAKYLVEIDKQKGGILFGDEEEVQEQQRNQRQPIQGIEAIAEVDSEEGQSPSYHHKRQKQPSISRESSQLSKKEEKGSKTIQAREEEPLDERSLDRQHQSYS